MALLGGYRSRRLARRAEAAFLTGGFEAAAAFLDAARSLGAAPWAHFAVGLYNRERKPEAERAILRALEIEPARGDALIFLAELQAETDRRPEAIATYQRVMARFPRALEQALALAKLHAAGEDYTSARDVLRPLLGLPSNELPMLLAAIHYALGEHAEVIALLAPMVRQMKLELQGLVYGNARQDLYNEYQEALRLHDESYAILHGREQVIEVAKSRGDLDAQAGVNYRLLGEARMIQPPKWTAEPRLMTVEAGLAHGLALVAAGERSRGLCHQGQARLRQGRLDDARRLFDHARDLDDDNFAAYLGLGAAMVLERARAFERVAQFPEVRGPLPAGLEQVVVDWPVLTERERQVVLAVTAPLAKLLPNIAAAGAEARLLPIDIRLADLPEMQWEQAEVEEEGEQAGEPGNQDDEARFEDHRCLEGITGAANARICASKIEELLGLTGEHDSVFAHELAHLAHFHAPEQVQQQIEELFEQSLQHEHILTAYQTTNSAEFFAVAYTDFIAHEYRLMSRRELDDEGVIEDTFALFRTLA
jgi:tetratricopeptide (TPR) repeat protein